MKLSADGASHAVPFVHLRALAGLISGVRSNDYDFPRFVDFYARDMHTGRGKLLWAWVCQCNSLIYYPAFPYTSYQRMKMEDVRDLFAYLKTLPPVEGKPRDHELPFYLKIRRLLGGWKFLYLDGRQFEPDPAKSAEVNRGAYLVNGPGHCAECHSPRNRLGAVIASERFAGGPDPEGGDGWVPNITPAGIGDYSQRDIERILETGDMPNGDSVGGPMAAVVSETSKLSAEDLGAIAAYLKSLPPIQGPKRP